jgi:hypothetical protein
VVLDWAKSSKEKSISPSKMNLNGFINSNELVGNLKMNLEMKYRNFRRSLSPTSHEDCWIISPLIPMLQEKIFQNVLRNRNPQTPYFSKE